MYHRSEFVAFWKRNDKKQVISQAEMFPVLISKFLWSEVLAGRSVLWFLDNESARTCFVRNYSPVLDNFFMLQFNGSLDMSLNARHWYSRVPSRSNLSDAASRLDFAAYRGFVRTRIDYQPALEALDKFKQLVENLEKGK